MLRALGGVSMELFLVHWPMIMYLNWVRHSEQRGHMGPLPWLPPGHYPDGMSSACAQNAICVQYSDEPWYDAWYDARRLPGWGVPVAGFPFVPFV